MAATNFPGWGFFLVVDVDILGRQSDDGCCCCSRRCRNHIGAWFWFRSFSSVLVLNMGFIIIVFCLENDKDGQIKCEQNIFIFRSVQTFVHDKHLPL